MSLYPAFGFMHYTREHNKIHSSYNISNKCRQNKHFNFEGYLWDTGIGDMFMVAKMGKAVTLATIQISSNVMKCFSI